MRLADLLPTPGDWAQSALCAQIDPEAWFPEKGQSTKSAKKVCAACPVTAECLQVALDGGERYGVWGGVSERDRRKMSAQIQAQVAS